MSIRVLEPNDASDDRSENAAQPILSYTAKQGQYVAFIYYYSKIHLCSPSEADMQRYFCVSPSAVHQMVLSLEKLGFIERTPGQGRSVKLLVPRDQLPDLM
ncbi:MAG: MarR family transcriptional regulator [Betaproteobacteria bacterium]|nr:MarR family transcriptional regulator [Betaproteobacteria bacterium]